MRAGTAERKVDWIETLGWDEVYNFIPFPFQRECVCAYDIWLQLCNFIARICLMMWTMQFPSQKICNNSLSQCHHSHCRCRHRRSSSSRRAFPIIIWKMVKFFPSQILYWNCSRRGTRLKIYILNAQYIACTLHFNDNLITLFVMLMSISITQSRWWWWCITSNVKCLGKNDDDKNFNFQSVYKNAIAQKNPIDSRKSIWILKKSHTQNYTYRFFPIRQLAIIRRIDSFVRRMDWTTFSPGWIKKRNEKRNASTCN